MKSPVEDLQLPQDWQVAPISSLADFRRGISWRKEDESPTGEGTLVVSIPNIKDGWIDYQSKFNHYIGIDIPESKLLSEGDIVFVGSSGSLHNVGRNAKISKATERHVAYASFTFRARPHLSVVDSDFFYFLVNSDLVPFPVFCKRAADGKFNFQLGDFSSRLLVPLPPLAEQKAIARDLAAVKRTIAAQERIIQTTTELKQALMQKLFSEGLRGEPQKQTEIGLVPESWEVVKLEYIAKSFEYGTSVKCGYDVQGKRFLRIPNVDGGAIKTSDLKFGNPKPNEEKNLRLQAGDLLFVRTNGVKENAGRCSLFKDEIEDCYFASYLIRVRLDSCRINPSFLNEYSQTGIGISFLSGKAIRTADGKFNINAGTLKTMLVPVPSIDEQEEIAQALALIASKSTSANAKKSELQDLFLTLLHELMTGQTRVHDLRVSA